MKFGKKELLFVIGGAVCFSVICLCVAKSLYKKYDFDRINRILPTVPVAIIGSGPAGVGAALESEHVGLSGLVIQGDMPGGLITQAGVIENWPGFVNAEGYEIADTLINQAKKAGAQFLDDTVTRVDFSCWPFKIYIEGDRCIQALTVIIATGSTPKKLGIPGEKEHRGRGISYCAICDGPLYKEKEVLVIGGGDSAVKEAIHLAGFAKKVTILVRRDRMRASLHNQEKLREYPTISIVNNVNPQEIIGKDGHVTGVRVLDTVANEVRIIAAGGVFVAIGHEPNTKLFKDFIALDEVSGRIKLTKDSQETSVNGIFAAGDVAARRHRQAQIASGDGEAAALDAKEFLENIGFTKQTAAKLCLFKPDMTGVDVSPAKSVGDGSVKELFSLADFSREVEGKKGLVCMNVIDTDASGQRTQEVAKMVAQALAGTMAFVTVDKHKAADIAQRFFVDRTPCRLVFNNGSLVARNQRDMDAQELSAFAQEIVHEAAVSRVAESTTTA